MQNSPWNKGDSIPTPAFYGDSTTGEPVRMRPVAAKWGQSPASVIVVGGASTVQITELTMEISRLRESINAMEQRLATIEKRFHSIDVREHVAPRSAKARAAAKSAIRALFSENDGETIYPSDVSHALNLDYDFVTQMIDELEADGKIKKV